MIFQTKASQQRSFHFVGMKSSIALLLCLVVTVAKTFGCANSPEKKATCKKGPCTRLNKGYIK